ncbi:MAG: alpha-1,2-fucosyltransferase [Gammaproteobacteria bacterium]|nr:alpha-1,2-fucosyltransferase [Gammaproteobacteria bacterium]
MIVSQILGGLGNQMFQYAAGRALSLAVEQPFLLDLRGFNSYALHNGFELGRIFSAQFKEATASDISFMLGWRSPELVRKVLKRVKSPLLNGTCLAIEPHFNYWAGIRVGGLNRYLMGYWQSEMYFKDHAKALRSDFKFTLPLDEISLNIAQCIQNNNAISLHVRRGDYITHAPNSKILNVCSVDYYNKAIDYISQRVGSPHFFLFSDDMEWVKATLNIPFKKTYVEHNRGADNYRDMQLMHLCRHHIIANSSFSWWGAWLNPYPDKLVVAPKSWFCDGKVEDDLIPPEWTRL